MVMSLYPTTKSNPQLAQNVVGMFDQVMGAEIAEEFKPASSQNTDRQLQDSLTNKINEDYLDEK